MGTQEGLLFCMTASEIIRHQYLVGIRAILFECQWSKWNSAKSPLSNSNKGRLFISPNRPVLQILLPQSNSSWLFSNPVHCQLCLMSRAGIYGTVNVTAIFLSAYLSLLTTFPQKKPCLPAKPLPPFGCKIYHILMDKHKMVNKNAHKIWLKVKLDLYLGHKKTKILI